MNGYTWYTKQQDDKSTVQNSGVSLVALSGTDSTLDSYYGWTYDYQFYNVDGTLLLELGGFTSTTQQLTLKYSDEKQMLLYIASNKGGIGYTILVDR